MRVSEQEKALFWFDIGFMSNWNFMVSWVEHEKSFITLGPDSNIFLKTLIHVSDTLVH